MSNTSFHDQNGSVLILYTDDYDMTNSSSNETKSCSNEYCISDEDYLSLIEDYIFPTTSEWVLISLHVTVFVVGLIGNALVCLSVYRNHSMRTVTNYFIVNLAFADFLVIFVCLPPSVLWDVTETWFFGRITCKLVLYLQNVSVSVSVLTLTFISIDRWYAICHPLKFKSTASRARISIFIIWTISMLIVLPEAVILDTKEMNFTLPPGTPPYLTDCTYTWPEFNTRMYQLFLIAVLYVAPFSLMGVSYYQMTKVLWSKRNIPGSVEMNNHSMLTHDASSKGGKNGAVRVSSVSCEGQIKSRRKASKMLIAVVVIFIICYFPVHLINALRYTIGLPQNPATTAASLISHWLCYANSAINPIIYNIMNGKFRKEFKNVFTCTCLKSNKGMRRRKGTMYLCRYTNTVAVPNEKQRIQNFT